MSSFNSLRDKLARFRSDDEGGVSTLEFVIIAPVLFFMFLATFEAGWLMTRQMMLDRGVDIAMREVRLNMVPGISHQQLKENICDDALGITNCSTNLRIEMLTLDEARAEHPVVENARYWPHSDVACQERGVDIDPVVDEENFGTNQPDVLMIVVACVMVDPLVPGLGGLIPGMTSTQEFLDEVAVTGYKMTSFAAYKAEPDI